jgi:regulator of cell morphogenesis and NO signaling
MYLTNKTFITSDMKISDLIKDNPSILLVLEYFGIDDVLKDKSVEQLCRQYGISDKIFTIICNMYNGFSFTDPEKLESSDIPVIISFLNNSHLYYKNEKYPEIINYIKQLNAIDSTSEMKLVELFFNEYFEEVKEHLDYEEKTAFPYFFQLYNNRKSGKENFSAQQYLNHHTDIESKLEDLKNLLLKHLHIKNQGSVKRKLLYSLFELEFDLKIHSMIEEQILIPMAISIETN